MCVCVCVCVSFRSGLEKNNLFLRQVERQKGRGQRQDTNSKCRYGFRFNLNAHPPQSWVQSTARRSRCLRVAFGLKYWHNSLDPPLKSGAVLTSRTVAGVGPCFPKRLHGYAMTIALVHKHVVTQAKGHS